MATRANLTDKRAAGALIPVEQIGTLLDRKEKIDKKVIVRQMHVRDFRALIQEVNTDSKYSDWQYLTIYADRIKFAFEVYPSFGIDLTDRREITIVARQMKVTGKGKFFIVTHNPDQSTKARLSIQEYEGPLVVLAVSKDGSSHVTLSRPEEGASRVDKCVVLQPEVKVEVFDRPLDDWKIGSDFYWTLVTTFQDAFSILPKDNATALSRFRWVQDRTVGIAWKPKDGDTGTHAEMEMLGAQAAGMVARLERRSDANFIPRSDVRSILKSISLKAKAAEAFESRFDDFRREKALGADRQKYIDIMLKELIDRESEVERQIKVVGEKLANAESTLKANLVLVKMQSNELGKAQKAFEDGIEKKKIQSIFDAVFTLLTDLGSLAAGGPSAGKTVQAVGKLAKLVENLKKVVAVLKKIGTFAKAAHDVYTLAKKIEGKHPPGEKLIIPRSDQSDMFTDADWAVLREQFQAALLPYTLGEDKIDGASEYLEAGRIMVIYGQATNASRCAVADIQERWVALRMQLGMHEAQKARLKSYVDGKNQSERDFLEMAVLMRQRYLEVKRGLLVQLEDFNDAYRFWALNEPNTEALDVNSRITEMARLMTRLDKVIDDGLNNLFPRHQDAVEAQIYYTLSSEDKGILKSGKTIWIPVLLEDEKLGGRDRVRIHRIKIYFEGLRECADNMDKRYDCRIKSSKFYQDRWGKGSWSFIAEDTQEFAYSKYVQDTPKRFKHPKENYIINDDGDHRGDLGQISDDPFYRPALFTIWAVRLPSDLSDNSDLDLSTTTGIRLVFHGTAMGSKAMRAMKRLQSLHLHKTDLTVKPLR